MPSTKVRMAANMAPHNVGLKEHVSFINQFVFIDRPRSNLRRTTVGAFYTRTAGREGKSAWLGEGIHIVVSIAIHRAILGSSSAGTTGGSIDRERRDEMEENQ